MFIDFIRLVQEHEDDQGRGIYTLPKVDSGYVYKYSRDENGEFELDHQGNLKPEWISVSRRFVEGSFDSIYIIKSDGHRVEFEGNIGRFGRPDNLFNLDFDQTLDMVNRILASHGLPPFSAGMRVLKHNPSAYDVEHGLFWEWTGARVSELHLTENYRTGSMANAQAAIDWLASQSVSRVRRGRGGETSTSWGSKASRKHLKAYLKAPEMLVHRHGRTAIEVKEDPVYQYAESEGILRIELEAKRLLLRDNKLNYLGDITMSKLIRLYQSEAGALLNRVKTDVTRLELETLPAAVRMTASAYLRGENVRAMMSRATFYRHSKVLLGYGIDISEPLADMQKFCPVINVIQLQPIDQVPEWYWAHQRKLSLKVA